MQTGDGDRERLPKPIKGIKADPILSEAQSMEQIETKDAADQYEQPNAAETMQPVFSDDQVASSESL
jgi:hypothetical protein